MAKKFARHWVGSSFTVMIQVQYCVIKRPYSTIVQVSGTTSLQRNEGIIPRLDCKKSAIRGNAMMLRCLPALRYGRPRIPKCVFLNYFGKIWTIHCAPAKKKMDQIRAQSAITKLPKDNPITALLSHCLHSFYSKCLSNTALVSRYYYKILHSEHQQKNSPHVLHKIRAIVPYSLSALHHIPIYFSALRHR